MTPQKQLFRHRPEEGRIGDCWRTCFACLLDLHPSDVPHFVEPHMDDGPAATRLAREWLSGRGLSLIQFAFASDLQSVLDSQASCNPNTYFILGGTSRTGVLHAVIACNAEIVWDPSPDDAGIVGPDKDGLYWIEFLVPSLTVRRE